MKPSELKMLGAVAAFEREGVICSRELLTFRAKLQPSAGWNALRALVTEGLLVVDVDHDSPRLMYSLSDRAAAALDALEIP